MIKSLLFELFTCEVLRVHIDDFMRGEVPTENLKLETGVLFILKIEYKGPAAVIIALLEAESRAVELFKELNLNLDTVHGSTGLKLDVPVLGGHTLRCSLEYLNDLSSNCVPGRVF